MMLTSDAHLVNMIDSDLIDMTKSDFDLNDQDQNLSAACMGAASTLWTSQGIELPLTGNDL